MRYRIADASGNVKQSQYKAGLEDCGSGGVSADQLSQNGARYLETNCGFSDWRAILDHYYNATFPLGKLPTRPKTDIDHSSPSVAPGELKLTFHSRVSNGAGRTSDVAWRYIIGKCTQATLVACLNKWRVAYDRGYSSAAQTVPTTWTSRPSGCAFYRVRARNPVGDTQVVLFSSAKLCPKA